MASDATDIKSSWKQDSEYCFEDAYFLVENTLFKVPKHHFEEGSPVFGDMFRLPAGDEVIPEGSTKANPIHLQLISAQDFRQLLRVLYPRHYKREHLTVSQWSSVLKLATMWDFDEVRSTAIDELDAVHIEGPTLLALAQDYNVEQWWAPALRLLANADALTEEDVGRLGISTSMRVALFQGHVAGYKQRQKEESRPSAGASQTPSQTTATPAATTAPAATTVPSAPSSQPAQSGTASWGFRSTRSSRSESHIDKTIQKIFPEVKLLYRRFDSSWG